MHSMSDWYLHDDNDQSRLTRILDVAQDLKALSSLLNVRSFQFVIDLACLASRHEYLKLDKWLTDKIREHGEQFVQSIVTFLQRRCPQIGDSTVPDKQIQILLTACWTACSQIMVSQDLCGKIHQIQLNYQIFKGCYKPIASSVQRSMSLPNLDMLAQNSCSYIEVN